MNSIIVIGTQPPCPRCKLLTEIVKREAKQLKLNADIKHIAYTSDEAANTARDQGLIPGTAKDVAKILGEEIDFEGMSRMSHKLDPDFLTNLDEHLKPLEGLFKEVSIMDEWLRSYENRAKGVGILMTPVLIINGEVKHTGSVPKLSKIIEWLTSLG